MRRSILLFVSLIFFCSCEQTELVSDLSQDQAIEVLSVLNQSNISAEKESTESGKKKTFSLKVSKSDYKKAINTLYEYGLPKNDRNEFEDLTSKQGFIPNPPQIVSLRVDRAKASELERMLSLVPGVIEARAIVSSNIKLGSPNVSVVLKTEQGELASQIDPESIRQIIKRAIPDVLADNVAVIISRVSPKDPNAVCGVMGASVVSLSRISPHVLNFMVPEMEVKKARLQLLTIMSLVVVASVILGMLIARIVSILRRGR